MIHIGVIAQRKQNNKSYNLCLSLQANLEETNKKFTLFVVYMIEWLFKPTIEYQSV